MARNSVGSRLAFWSGPGRFLSRVKCFSMTEAPNKAVARKSIVAARPIQAGEVFTADNLTTKRPGDGISPMRWYEVLGQTAKRAFEEDEKIEL